MTATAGGPPPVTNGEVTVESFDVGSVRVTRVQERIYEFPILDFMPTVTPDRLSAQLDWLQAFAVRDTETMVMPVNGYVVETRGRRILVDTCVGIEHTDSEPTSPFVDRLAEAGFAPESIDVVVCTHFHYDHVGWNTTVDSGRRRPTFPNARYLLARREWEAAADWSASSELEEMLQESFDRDIAFLVQHDAADLVESDASLTEDVSLLGTTGHSPGHVAVVIASEGVEAIITGDSIHHPVQIVEPHHFTTADDDINGAVSTRLNLLDRAYERKSLLIGSHFGGAGRGHVVTDRSGYSLRAAT